MTEPFKPARRIVIVHGHPDPDLVDILRNSHLEPVITTESTTIWAPAEEKSHDRQR